MEAVFSDAGISVGKIVEDQPRVTPAVLVYCDKLVEYLATQVLATMLVASLSPYPSGQALAVALAVPNVDVRVVLRKAIVDLIKGEIDGDQGRFVTFGLGRMYGLLPALINQTLEKAFSASLSYAIYDCQADYSNMGDYADIDFIVKVTTRRLNIPSDMELIDGILVSEGCIYSEGPLNNCVCLESVPLWPNEDSHITFTPNDDAYEGTYRLQTTGPLEGHFYHDVDYSSPNTIYLVFRNPSFLQGIQSMDKILKATKPTWKNLEIYQGGQWIPAKVTAPGQ